MSTIKDFPLGIAPFHFSDLYKVEKLPDLHLEFWKYAEVKTPGLKAKFDSIEKEIFLKPQIAEVLILTAKTLGDFVSKLFNVTNQTQKIKQETLLYHPVFRFKKEFLNTRVYKRFTETPMGASEFKTLNQKISAVLAKSSSQPIGDLEISTAETVLFLLDCEKKIKAQTLSPQENQKLQDYTSYLAGNSVSEKIVLLLKDFEDWCTQLYLQPEQNKKLENWISYIRPNKLDFEHLVSVENIHLHPRDGFKLTDNRMSFKRNLREIDYCIYCHQREKDSCSHGFTDGQGGFKKNPLGVDLKGCPLDERISEMHYLRREGELVAALAMIMLDNPMCPGTGHRICNDCMKGCIFQKQDPVNIPENETAVLSQTLNLPYGFEIYSLLTRFNPLNRKRPYALPYNGKNMLVVGLGPAGYTLAHYLSNEGFGVVGIDGLKLEPLDPFLTGKEKAYPKPISDFSELKKELDERMSLGFGGVSEYGITVRWDKNFLSVIYLTLLRKQNIQFYGGIRFGGTLTIEDAWELGFDHIAIATGAGKPTLIDMKNNLCRGIRKASDFLMSLQLGGAFKKNNLNNLEIQLPAVVVGGGLTAVDTATESLSYYPIQVEKILEQFETISKFHGEKNLLDSLTEEEKERLKTYLNHASLIKEERVQASKEKRKPNFIPLLQAWGGVSIVYRKRLEDSPAYRLNHEEVTKALEEGISFLGNVTPLEAKEDKWGHLSHIEFKNDKGEKFLKEAKSAFVAAGTSPNTIYEKEYPGTFKMCEKGYFKKYAVKEKTLVEDSKGFFTSYENHQRFVSFFGDNHPNYAGNVVKAMASAKDGYPKISELYPGATTTKTFSDFTKKLDQNFLATVVEVKRLTPTIVEIIVKAKLASKKFEPGQFYRLQNFETYAHSIEGKKLIIEPLALTGAWVDKEKELLSLIVLEMGVSSRLCASLKSGEKVVLMGPTGTPTEIPKNNRVLLAGGGLGNAVLLSVAKALKSVGSSVIYFAGYRRKEDLFKQTEIEKNTDQVIWSVDSGEKITPSRPQDYTFQGKFVESMLQFAKGNMGSQHFKFSDTQRIIAIGSDRMMHAITQSRHGVLQPYLNKNHEAIASINSPMQCMMKEICAQCLQKHFDPVTKKEYFVFSCFNQDQEMDKVDFKNLNQRLKVNSLSEKLSNLYLSYLYSKSNLEKI
jgi:NADPH-dependent glutamate synthase beta subunit-like oxidoreductase/NAD(P)H-flavin reductase